MKQEYVYHASKIPGLKRIEPKPSTHKKPWVYATKNIVASAMFLGSNFDFICQTGISDGKPQIYERFKGALSVAYEGQAGSIYKLSAKTFEEGKTSWSAEVVSEVAVDVIEEIPIENAMQYLENLAAENKLSILRFPNLPPHVPKNKEDIIEKGIKWTFDFGEKALERVKKYHPDVLDRVISGLKEKEYTPESEFWKKEFGV